MFSTYPVTHIFSPMKNRPPVKFYNPFWPTSQNVDSCYRATRSSISSFIRPLRNGSFMTFLRSTGTQTKSRQRVFVCLFGFLFSAPCRPPAAALGGSLGEKTLLTGRRRSRGPANEISPLHLLLLVSSLSRAATEGRGEAVAAALLLFGCLFLFCFFLLFYGLYSNSPRVKLFLEPPSVIISSPYQYSPPTGVISVLIRLKEYYAVPGPRLN